jgi:hypothetical protein
MAFTDTQSCRLNGTIKHFRRCFDRMNAFQMAVKLNTWLMDLACFVPDPVWRDDLMTEYLMADELVERLRQKVTELGWPAPSFPDPTLNPVSFAHEAWAWVWWISPNLEMVSDPDHRANLEMAMADAIGRH